MTTTPNLLIGTATDSRVDECVNTLLSVSGIPMLVDDHSVFKLFNEKLKPATANDPGFRHHERYRSALEWLKTTALRESTVLGWQPESFMQSPVIQWAVLDNLPAAKFVFVLRNPVDSVHLHYRSHIEEFGNSFEAAIEKSIGEMNEVGSWSYRGKWERFYAKSALTTLLLESCAYATAVYRAQTLLGQDNVLVMGYEHYLENPNAEITRFVQFLKIDETEHVYKPELFAAPDSLSAIEPMHAETRFELTNYFRDQVVWLREITGFDASKWGFDIGEANVERDGLDSQDVFSRQSAQAMM